MEAALLDAAGALDVALVLDADELVRAGALLEALGDVLEGSATDADVQPASSSAADTARPAIADPRALDRVITLPPLR